MMRGVEGRPRPVSLGQRDEAPSGCHELVDVRIHSPRCGWSERTRGVSLWCLRRPSVVDDVVLQVLRHALTAVESLKDLGVGLVARDDDGATKIQPSRHGKLRELGTKLSHRHIEIDVHDSLSWGHILLLHLWEVLPHIPLERLEEDSLCRDLAFDLSVSRARDSKSYRTRGTMAREAHHTDIVTEIFPTELCANAHPLRELQHLLLQLQVTESSAVLVPRGGERVIIFGGGELNSLESHLRGEATDDDGKVVGWTGGGTDRLNLLLQKGHDGLCVAHQGSGLLVEKGLVGGPPSLGHEEELVSIARGGVHFDLRREVGASVDLLVHRQRGKLRVPAPGMREEEGGERTSGWFWYRCCTHRERCVPRLDHRSTHTVLACRWQWPCPYLGSREERSERRCWRS
jgi:hypothetical protein